MRKEHSRRSLLRVGGSALAIGLGGCVSESDPSAPETTARETRTTVTTSVATPDEPECEYEAIDPDEPSGTIKVVRDQYGQRELAEYKKARFQSRTDNEVEYRGVPPGCLALLRAKMNDEDRPHLINHSHDQVYIYDEEGFLSDQTGNIDVPECVLPEKAQRVSRFEGRLVGVPWAAETVALFYNRDMVESPPETLEEMQSIMAQYHVDDGETFGLGYPINPYYASAFAQAYGEEVYDEDADELGLDTDAVEKGLRVIMEDLRPYMPDDPEAGAQKSVFENGNAPFLITGNWDIDYLEQQDFELGVTTLPDLPDGGTPRPYAGYKILYFTTRMDDDPAGAGAARNYARWLATDEEILLEHADREDIVPVHAELRASGRLPETIQGFADQLETADPMPRREEMYYVWGPYGHAVEQTFNGREDLRANLDTAAEEIRERWADQELSRSGGVEPAVNRLSLDSAGSGCGGI